MTSSPLVGAGEKLVIASHNPGKVREIAELLAPLDVSVLAAADLGLDEPEETGASFAENAALKARAAAAATGLASLADDSGLVVPVLGGAPGIQSARWAGPERDFAAAMQKIETALDGKSDRRASFVCVLALARPEGDCDFFEGEITGHLVWPPRGERGFGYDPMFVAEHHTRTFGEIDPVEKHAISHRARAFRRLLAAGLAPALRS